ncbi:hypothetical protein TGGT1_253850 [Toxoplasma gondii GT1]|uniref:CCHC-type domain-containing protein n=3 Tax=Toxoplasma gondii TaxID=5811 RepID=S7ULU7_TOXGG|nr:hypothetical protein TGGT1_253850 [Toxoplasma gondii GT1]KAF4645347.1 hypothetical protein TGRH88_004510 [Toxoplasma gondii]KFG52956.1 hypothetical protein TGFOU_253850 [Toxoplasma gondii FOU]
MLFSSRQTQGNRRGCIDTDGGGLLCSFDTEGDTSLSSLVEDSPWDSGSRNSPFSIGEQRIAPASNRNLPSGGRVASSAFPYPLSSSSSSTRAKPEGEPAGRTDRTAGETSDAYASGSPSRYQRRYTCTAGASKSQNSGAAGSDDTQKPTFSPWASRSNRSQLGSSATPRQVSHRSRSSSSHSSVVPSSGRFGHSVAGTMPSSPSVPPSSSSSRFSSQAGELRKYRFAESRYFVSEEELQELKPDWLRRREEAVERRAALGGSFRQGGRRDGSRDSFRSPWGEAQDASQRTCCFLCFRDDHAPFQCTAKHVFCRLCAGFGHAEEACPLLLVEQSLRGELRVSVNASSHLPSRPSASESDEDASASPRNPQRGGRSLAPSPVSPATSSLFKEGMRRQSDRETGDSATDQGIRCLACGTRGHAICAEPPVTVLQLYCCRCGLYGHCRSDCPGLLSVRGSAGRQGFSRPHAASSAPFASRSASSGRHFASASPSRGVSRLQSRHTNHSPQDALFSKTRGRETPHRPLHAASSFDSSRGEQMARAHKADFDGRPKRTGKKEKKKERARAEKNAKHKERLREERKRQGKGSWAMHFGGGQKGTERGTGQDEGERETWTTASQSPAKRSKHRHRGLY